MRLELLYAGVKCIDRVKHLIVLDLEPQHLLFHFLHLGLKLFVFLFTRNVLRQRVIQMLLDLTPGRYSLKRELFFPSAFILKIFDSRFKLAVLGSCLSSFLFRLRLALVHPAVLMHKLLEHRRQKDAVVLDLFQPSDDVLLFLDYFCDSGPDLVFHLVVLIVCPLLLPVQLLVFLQDLLLCFLFLGNSDFQRVVLCLKSIESVFQLPLVVHVPFIAVLGLQFLVILRLDLQLNIQFLNLLPKRLQDRVGICELLLAVTWLQEVLVDEFNHIVDFDQHVAECPASFSLRDVFSEVALLSF